MTTASYDAITNNIWAGYNAQNQVASTNAPGLTWSPIYNTGGDVTDDGVNQYLYDAEGRVCALYVNATGAWTGYLYDAAGNRVAKGTIASWSCDITSNGFQQTAGYVVGPAGEQLTEVDTNNNWVHTNVYAGGKQIGTYDGNVSAPTLHFYFDDPLGTRRAQASAAGVLEAVYQSLPFGDGLAESIAAGADDPTENHFTGKERDTESGNDYFLARYYNSNIGRFLSPDWSAKAEPVPYAKLDNPQSLNLYAYVGNNPLGKIDPDGHCAIEGMDVGSGCSALSKDAIDWTHSSANRLSSKSLKAIGSAAKKYKFKAWRFEEDLAGQADKIDPNILVGLGYKESSLDPSANNGGLFQIQPTLAKQLGIDGKDIGNFDVQITAVGSALSGDVKTFGGNLDLGIASWTLGVSGTQKLYGAGGMDSVRDALLSTRHPEYGSVGPNYIDPIESFQQ